MALAGKVNEFTSSLDNLRRISSNDQIRTFFFPHALALSQYGYAASMSKEPDLQSVGFFDQNFDILNYLFDLEGVDTLLNSKSASPIRYNPGGYTELVAASISFASTESKCCSWFNSVFFKPFSNACHCSCIDVRAGVGLV